MEVGSNKTSIVYDIQMIKFGIKALHRINDGPLLYAVKNELAEKELLGFTDKQLVHVI